jgi:signal transduction histidine kinase
MDFFIRKRIIFSLGIIFVVILIVSFFAINTLRLQKYDSVRINLSGRQRMLSQKMTKEILHYYFEGVNKDAVLSTVKVFNMTLIALKDGGDAPLDLSMTKFKAIPEMENKETKNQLEKIMNSWSTFKEKIESVLENNDDSSMNYIIDNNTKLLDEMDAAVVMMQHNAEEKLTRLYWIIALGILISVLIFIVAIAEETRRKYVEQLENANLKLQELDHLKSMFIASMSHELRTPLNSIIGFTGIILQGMSGKITEDQRKELTMVKNSANHLLTLINDVIDVSKIEAGKVELVIKEFNLTDLMQEVKDSFKIATDEKSLKLSLEMPEKLIIKSDERRTKQVIMNLVSNAVKFTDRGEIEIKVRKKDEEVEVSVADTGIGIKKENMKKLFKQFSRIYTEDKPVTEGTGLGLYLSKKIVDLLGGQIKAKSEFGKGSMFTFTFPLKYTEVKV